MPKAPPSRDQTGLYVVVWLTRGNGFVPTSPSWQHQGERCKFHCAYWNEILYLSTNIIIKTARIFPDWNPQGHQNSLLTQYKAYRNCCEILRVIKRAWYHDNNLIEKWLQNSQLSKWAWYMTTSLSRSGSETLCVVVVACCYDINLIEKWLQNLESHQNILGTMNNKLTEKWVRKPLVIKAAWYRGTKFIEKRLLRTLLLSFFMVSQGMGTTWHKL